MVLSPLEAQHASTGNWELGLRGGLRGLRGRDRNKASSRNPASEDYPKPSPRKLNKEIVLFKLLGDFACYSDIDMHAKSKA